MYLGQQQHTSADTSLCQVPATVKLVADKYGWEPGTVNFDIGTGKCPDLLMHSLDALGVDLVVYDPHYYTADYNEYSLDLIDDIDGVETVTASNVLNVIKEPTYRAQVIRLAHDALKPDGVAYFLVHEGKRDSRGRKTKKGWQNNKKAEKYVPEIASIFPAVERHGRLIVAQKEAA
jgi:hypothetical protein